MNIIILLNFLNWDIELWKFYVESEVMLNELTGTDSSSFLLKQCFWEFWWLLDFPYDHFVVKWSILWDSDSDMEVVKCFTHARFTIILILPRLPAPFRYSLYICGGLPSKWKEKYWLAGNKWPRLISFNNMWCCTNCTFSQNFLYPQPNTLPIPDICHFFYTGQSFGE